MKLLMVCREFPDIIGGVSDYTYRLGISLSEEGHNVYVLTSDDKRIRTDVEKLHVVPAIKRWDLRGISAIINEAQIIAPDRILIQYVPHMYDRNAVPLYLLLLYILLRLRRFKIITTFHEIALRADITEPAKFIVGIIERLIAYCLLSLSDKAVVSIEHYRRLFWPFYVKILKIPVGSNIEPISLTEKETVEFRRKVAVGGENIVATFGLNPAGNNMLIDAAKRLRESGIKLRLLLMGDLPECQRTALSEKAKLWGLVDSVILTGYLPAAEVYRHLSVADIFVMLVPTDEKGRGGVSAKNTAIAAAFASGLPVIGNEGDMTDKLFVDGSNIFLLKSCETGKLAAAIAELIKDDDARSRLAGGARKSYELYFAWPVIAKEYTEQAL